jgi:hypothetical protein
MGYSAYHHAKRSFYIPKESLQFFDRHFLLIWENKYIQSIIKEDGVLYRKENGKEVGYIPIEFPCGSEYDIKNRLNVFDTTQPFVLSFRRLKDDPVGFVLIKEGRK